MPATTSWTGWGAPRGLIRYDSLEGLAGKARRIVRPRLVLYTALLVVGAVVAVAATRRRMDFETTLLRLPGAPYAMDGTTVRDALQVHIVNKRAERVEYRIDVEPVDGMTALVSMPTVTVEPLADTRVPLFLTVEREQFHAEFLVHVRVARTAAPLQASVVVAPFLGPSR